jgi:NAD(P)-dependent dehydrogenase (short-subunit alcohol dehydrogenase family)
MSYRMDIENKVIVITGAASGIGRASAIRFAKGNAKAIVMADINLAQLEEAAQEVATYGPSKVLVQQCDVGQEHDIKRLANAARDAFGRIDIFFSNAGILGRNGGFDLEDALWDSMWRIHGMAHVWAARAVVPQMEAQGGGAFVITASAAGLLTVVESAPYAVTKHAALAFAEWLRVAYGRKGIQVSCLCPQAVRTGMVTGDGASAGLDGVLPAEQVADDVVAGLQIGQFLITPHPKVIDYFRAKSDNYDRWLGGMQKMYAKFAEARKH